MSDKIKPHRTIVLKREHIPSDACRDGLEAARELLPMRISTNPHENFEQAQRLVNIHKRQTWEIGHAHWLARRLGACTLDDLIEAGLGVNDGWDAWIVAQQLSWIADKLLSDRGK